MKRVWRILGLIVLVLLGLVAYVGMYLPIGGPAT
jgi:hypothetical protein